MLKPRSSPWIVAYAAAPLVSFLPFVHGVVAGGCFYFRDISAQFFPLRRFVVEGLRAGEIRPWNPYLNEGVPVLPISYPFDLLQALVPNEWGFSLLLALHVPLAALTFVGLARRLGCGPVPAVLGALVYALSGFSLSSVNLYIHIEALAWAPVVIGTLIGASTGGGREIAAAAVAVAVCLSTMGVEIGAQAVVCGCVLAVSRRIGGSLRLAGSFLLGLGLAAFPLLALATVVSGSPREGGLSIGEALDYSVHPASLLQTVIAGLHGDPMSLGFGYWGQRFWNGGFPYFISLYMGGAVLCLVAMGATGRHHYRSRLLLLLLAGTVICLGRWSRLDVVLELIPLLRMFRFPVKAFFTVLVASSLLASAAAQGLLTSHRAWRALAVGATLLGFSFLALPLLLPLLPAHFFEWLQESFFLRGYPQELRAPALRSIGFDAAAGALPLLAIAGLAVLRLCERIAGAWAMAAVTAIIAADLVRAGAGLNPTADRAFYTFSPEMVRASARMRESGGRVFTCAVQAMPAFREARRQRAGRTGVWTYGVLREALTPYRNMDIGIPTVGPDATGLVPTERALSAEEAMCRAPSAPAKLRAMGVRYVLNVQPLDSNELRLIDAISPARTTPLSIYIHELENSLPDPTVSLSPDDVDARGTSRPLQGAWARYLDTRPGRLRLSADTPRDAYLIVRRTNAAGWSATVNGKSAALVPANGRHQAVQVPAGISDVEMRYRAPNGKLGLGISLLSAVALSALRVGSRPRANPEAPAPALTA